MKTKAIFLGIVVGVASAVPSWAQVYSTNMVGYVQTLIPHGWSIIGNQVNADGSNTIGNLMPNPPVGLNVYRYINASGSFQLSIYDVEFGEWSNPGMPADPGIGLFVLNPGTNFTWSFFGQIAPRAWAIGYGYNLIAYPYPVNGTIGQLGYLPCPGAGYSDVVYKYINGHYESFIFDGEWGAWSVEPFFNVGEGFWLLRSCQNIIIWPRTFSVGQ